MLQVEYVPIGDIKPYKGNAKTHPQEQIEQIKKSILEFGFNDPIATWQGQVVEGHGRLEAAKQLGHEKVPVIRLDGLTDEQRRAYGLVHNQLTMNTPFDLDSLKLELDSIGEIDLTDMGFDLTLHDDYTNGEGFFQSDRSGHGKQEGNEEYNDFVDKFELKHTTDDCYTPDNIYEVVLGYCVEKYGISREDVVRPFYPGGDYEQFPYKGNAVVVDNPPFSILAKIVDFYKEKGIKFFLFAPALTVMSYAERCCCVCINSTVVYENGATIATSFVTNMENDMARTDPALYASLDEANKENLKELHKEVPSYEYPSNVVTGAMLGYQSRWGVIHSIPRDEAVFIRELDSQKEEGKSLYGGALLVSEAQAQAQAQAQANKGEATVWALSDREKEIIKSLEN